MFRLESGNNLEDIVVYFASILHPENYLELGSCDGNRIKEVAKYAERAIGIDIVQPANVAGYEFYCLTTNKFFDMVRDSFIEIPQFDMVFIDADHSHEQSVMDFSNVLPYVRKDGLIFLHDTYVIGKSGVLGDSQETLGEKSNNQVFVTIRNIRNSGYETITIPVHPGMSIIRKNKHVNYQKDKL